MEFILDVTSPKIQRAMKALSITNEDLRVKTPRHFQSSGIPEHISRLRYSHYTAKSSSLANKVLNYLKNPTYTSQHKTSALCQYKSAFRETHNEKFKKTYEKALISFYEFEKQTRKSEVDVNLKVDRENSIGNRLKEFVLNRKEKLESKFFRNKENLKAIEMERERKTEMIVERMSKRRKSQSVCQSRERSFRVRNHCEVDDVEQKLREFNRRMNKSSENYQKFIKEKVDRIREKDFKKHSKSQSNNYEELVSMIKTKHEGAETRRIKLKEELLKKNFTKEHETFQRVKYNRDSTRSETKEKVLKEKEKKTQDFLLRLKLQQRHEIEYKHEKHKLFEDNVNENVNRQRKVMNIKKEKIIEKHLELIERQKEQTEFLEKSNRKTREKAMNFTLKREKILALKSRISKSQTPEKLNVFIRTL